MDSHQNQRIVLIHGLLAPLACFRRLEEMIQAAEAVSIHLIGYGDHYSAVTEGITLSRQARHVAEQMERRGWSRAWVMGHSVGGAVAMLLADQRPDLVAGVINSEGNFTLKDAFWSSRIAKMSVAEWEAEFGSMLDDPAGWISRADINSTPECFSWAKEMLASQPASTIQAMARAVIAETTPPTYLEALGRVVDRGTPLHLIAGERAVGGRDVTDWARRSARSFTVIPGTGHMMMEAPQQFCSELDRILEARSAAARV